MRNIINDSKMHLIKIKVIGSDINSFIKRLYKISVFPNDINYLSADELIITINYDDYYVIKKEFVDLKFKKLNDLGIYKIKPFFKKNIIILVSMIISILFIYFLSNIIVKVDVIHSNKEIRELVAAELEELGIRRLTLKKDYNKLEEIKQILLDKYPNRLEWLEIEVEGMTYSVRIEERIITEPLTEKDACHVVATKDGIITKVIAHSGEVIKRVNSYVKKGDIIISGEIKLNDTVKSNVCANGSIYAEVWYTVDVSVDLNYVEHALTGKTRKNIQYETSKNKHSILRSVFENYDVKNNKMFSLFGVNFYIQTESEYEAIPKTYSDSEAENKGIQVAREKIELTLGENESIIREKVLKKSTNNSTMELEIFFSVNELINNQIEYEPIVDEKEE